jgi:hypothetical protein
MAIGAFARRADDGGRTQNRRTFDFDALAPEIRRPEFVDAERNLILRRLLVAAGLVIGLVGPSFADPAVTTAWSNMRRAPNGHARVVQSVPANAEIDLQTCSGDWCYASWRNRFGWIPTFAVGEADAAPPAVAAPPIVVGAPPVVVDAPPVVVDAPPVVVGPAWGGPYVGVGYGWGWRRW